MTTAPRLSIALVSTEGAVAADAIAALAQQTTPDVELIVACRADEEHHLRGAVRDLERGGRAVMIVTADHDATIGALRSAALGVASGDLVALVGDRYVIEPDWVRTLVDAHRSHPDAQVMYGAIEHAGTGGLFGWAVHYCEYGRFMRPFSAGPARGLPGSNVWFTRAVAHDLARRFPNGASELAWSRYLAAGGVSVWRDPRPVVRHRRAFRPGEYLAERYDYARSFTAERLNGATVVRRAFHAAQCLLLPPVVMTRVCLDVGRLPGHRVRLTRALPYLLSFTMAGVAGEIAGSLRLSAGPRRARG